jgi:hypothetical protein
VNNPLQLLKAKRSSALKDARRIEAQFARIDQADTADRTKSNLHTIVVAMFREHAAALEDAIRSAKLERG